jgi:hypothetical protein
LEQASSTCKTAVEKLIATIASQTGVEASHTDPLELFNALTSQKGGGGVYVDVPAEHMNDYIPEAARGDRPAGGSGLSWIFESSAGRQRISVVFIKGTFNATSAEVERLKFTYLVTGIHEITHNAPRSGWYYNHPEMDKPARTLKAKDFDDYVEKHCIPSKYWSKP